MTFQQNVRATFYWRTFAKKASIIALAITFITSLSIASESDVLPAYRDLLFMAVLVGVVFYFTSQPQVNIFGGIRWYRLADIWRPILLGLMIVLASMLVLFVFFRFPVAEGSLGQKFRDVFLWAIVVGFTEEYVRWTWLQTLPYSLVVANLVWIILHPQVAVIWNGQPPNWFFVVWSFAFGTMATAIMWAYESRLPFRLERYLGPIMAATIHAGFNALTVIWRIQVFVPGAGDTVFHPMYAPMVVALGALTFLLHRAKVARAGRAARVRSRPGVDAWRS